MTDRSAPATLDQLRDHLRRQVFRPGVDRRGRIAAEVELTPLRPLANPPGGCDYDKVQVGVDQFWDAMGGSARRGRIDWRGGALTAEPGGQIEYSGQPFETACLAARDLEDAVDLMIETARGVDVSFDLIGVGLHPWGTPEEVGLHLSFPRYPAMQAYFDRIGAMGRRMMRLTGSVQVCIDHAPAEELAARWELAQRLAPVLTAAFANGSIQEGQPNGLASARADAWLTLDPARTGFPPAWLDNPQGDPVEQYWEFALNAPVMFRVDAQGVHHTLPPHFTFCDWIHQGLDPIEPDGSAYPSLADWDRHLSTLFPEVRPRGYLELRSIDAPGLAWLSIPILVVGTVLSHADLSNALLADLRSLKQDWNNLRRRAAHQGLSDPILGDLAEHLFDLTRSRLRGCDEAMVSAYSERYIRPRRSPGQERLDRLVRPGSPPDPWSWIALEGEQLNEVRALRVAEEAHVLAESCLPPVDG